MNAQYIPIVLMAVVALGIALVMFLATSLLGPRNLTREKAVPYESGSDPVGKQQPRMSVKYYLVAVLFVLFDVELVFLFPWSTVYRKLGWLGFVEMSLFVVLVSLGLLTAWKKKALAWRN